MNTKSTEKSGSRMLDWTWRLVLVFFCASALAGWVQLKRSRIIYTPTPVLKDAWFTPVPVPYQVGAPGESHMDFVRMMGRRGGHTNHVPTLQVKLSHHPLGSVLHVGIHRTNKRPAELEVSVNGTVLATHRGHHKRFADIVEVAIPGALLSSEGEPFLTVRNIGEGAWFGRMLVIPYGLLRRPLQVVLPLSGFLLLLSGAVRQHMRGRSVRAIVPGLVVFFVYLHALFASKMVPMAGLVFSDGDELVQPFVTNVMALDLTKHMLCLPVIHGLWRVFSVVGWAEMVALAGAFSLVAAANVVVAHMVFRRLVRRDLSAMLLTLCYAGSFSIWLYSSMIETFVFSTLMTNLFLLVWLSSRASSALRHSALQAVVVVLCGLAHPPLLVFLGAVIHQWLRMWRKRNVVATLFGTALLVLLTCGGFLGGRFLLRRAYIDSGDEFATTSVADEYTDAGKMVDLYASIQNMTWGNVGNMVLGQCVYSIGGCEPRFDWSGGWSAGWIYCRRLENWPVILGLILLWVLALRGVVLRRSALVNTSTLVLLVMFPYMLFFLWFNPGEMLLYSPPMMVAMLGWLAWAGRPGSPRLFDAVVAGLAGVVVCINTVAIMSFH